MDSRAKAGGILALFGVVGVILIIIAFMCIERVPQGTVGVEQLEDMLKLKT